MTRVCILPDSGTLFINTDVHGNLEDFDTMRAIFEAEVSLASNTRWVILGDVVHAPSDEARARKPELYDYDDGSYAIVEQIAELTERYPNNVHFVLGNHDHAHIGGPTTRKFYHDEAEHLEAGLTTAERELFLNTLRGALLACFAPCGLALTHASPGRVFRSLEDFESIHFFPGAVSQKETAVLGHLLRCYGQSEADSRAYLESVSELVGFPLTTVIHGHDRDEEGFFVQENTQFCPVIFGAPRRNKRYLRIDMSNRYAGPNDLREGIEIRHLYPV